MECWKHIGGLLTGIAALLTASIPLFIHLKEPPLKQNTSTEQTTKKQSLTVKRQYALVNDPEGWVNLRSLSNVSSKVITRIENGYRVEIVDKVGNWYKVKTSIDEVGYIYHDRLKLVE
jgi:hypothetical protein